MKYARNLSFCLTVFALLVTVGGGLSAKVGFGFGPLRKPISLETRQPAAVRLANTSLFFEGASTNREYFPVQQSLLVTLGTELISHEKTLAVKDQRGEAEWTFVANVTGYSVAPPGKRTERSGNSTITYNRWSGSLNVAYRVIDKRGTVYDASNIDQTYNKEFEESATSQTSRFDLNKFKTMGHKKSSEVVPASPEDVKQILIKDVVGRIAAKLGNTTQEVEVQVAGGDQGLDHAVEFMKNGLWSRSLDELLKAPPFPKPEEESFRQYDLGLTYEAMSYDSKSSAEQREDIFKAAEFYDKALELNPNEKYFVATIARARDAVAHYEALDRMIAQDKKIKQVVTKTDEPKPNEDAKQVQPAVSLNDVIEMRSAGVGDDQVIEYIRSASAVHFEPMDKATMIAIAKAKLPISVQNALRARVNAPLLQVPPQVKNGAK